MKLYVHSADHGQFFKSYWKLVPLSCYSELMSFVALFCPLRVLPNTFDPSFDGVDWGVMSKIFSKCLPPRRRRLATPAGRQADKAGLEKNGRLHNINQTAPPKLTASPSLMECPGYADEVAQRDICLCSRRPRR